jgi:hypothetical protein
MPHEQEIEQGGGHRKTQKNKAAKPIPNKQEPGQLRPEHRLPGDHQDDADHEEHEADRSPPPGGRERHAGNLSCPCHRDKKNRGHDFFCRGIGRE